MMTPEIEKPLVNLAAIALLGVVFFGIYMLLWEVLRLVLWIRDLLRRHWQRRLDRIRGEALAEALEEDLREREEREANKNTKPTTDTEQDD